MPTEELVPLVPLLLIVLLLMTATNWAAGVFISDSHVEIRGWINLFFGIMFSLIIIAQQVWINWLFVNFVQ